METRPSSVREWISSEACCDSDSDFWLCLCFSSVKAMGKVRQWPWMQQRSSHVSFLPDSKHIRSGMHRVHQSTQMFPLAHTHRKPALKLSSSAVMVLTVSHHHMGVTSYYWMSFWTSSSLLGSVRDSARLPSHISGNEMSVYEEQTELTDVVGAEQPVPLYAAHTARQL